MNLRRMKKAFTLVEMLIVVIIIGILMGALLPKLKGAQERARDTARKANLSTLSTALALYKNEKEGYPVESCTKDLKDDLKNYIDRIPSDPQNWRVTYGTKEWGCTSGSYAYSNLTLNWAAKAGMVLVADTETFGKVNNWVLTGDADYKTKIEFTGDTEYTNNLDNKICYEGVILSGSTNVQCSSTQQEGTANHNPATVYVEFGQ